MFLDGEGKVEAPIRNPYVHAEEMDREPVILSKNSDLFA